MMRWVNETKGEREGVEKGELVEGGRSCEGEEERRKARIG